MTTPRDDCLLFATSFMRDEQDWHNRYLRWYRYYRQSQLGNTPLVLIDDGSPFLPEDADTHMCKPDNWYRPQRHQLNIVRFEQNLGRQSLTSYPGWWRSFLLAPELAKRAGCRKIIHIESDAYILTERMFSLIENINEGWTTFWLPTYQMPETAIQVICEDQFDNMLAIWNHSDINRELAENILPFTQVVKTMKGDRYSEFKRNRWIFRSRKFDWFPPFKTNFFFAPIPPDADFATQVVPRQFSDIRFQVVLTDS